MYENKITLCVGRVSASTMPYQLCVHLYCHNDKTLLASFVLHLSLTCVSRHVAHSLLYSVKFSQQSDCAFHNYPYNVNVYSACTIV